ncbi:alpha-tubulin N-acetyltransferase 1-like [Strongylocentrotus purpuratus]|uniref:Alpha-tubulin N-acetyltransferase n=1 Tax=Strongylocentrotus purpuratus TaxID=7668 RepID=A0A7M7PPB8_STRPU|nr:alpha-tubulin N-acetyltransferase 1-like [Strongylocentrotus purpuratus]
MEFTFNVNHLFGESIAVVDRDLRPYRTHSHGSEDHQANLEKVIDQMGMASSKAQGLKHVITTARRLRFTDNKLYVVTDPMANGELGAVVGILKTGRKNLFVLDRHGNQTEMQPICVLDFYVHESCQRKGYGKKLFTHMLQAEGVKPHHLAIDRPSHKFQSFLMKHYRLRATIPQVNNFVIFEGFFNNQPESSYCRKRAMGKPPVPPNNRLVHQPSPTTPHRNATSSGVWGQGTSPSPVTARKRDKEVLRDVIPPSRGSSSGSNDGVAGLELSGLEISTRGMGAQASSYSRYAQNSTPPVGRTGSAGSRRSSFTNSPIAGSPLQGFSVGEQNRRNSLDNPRRGVANGNQPNTSKVSSSPPPFGHIGAFSTYNSHLQTQSRNGHLKVLPNSTPITNNRLDNQVTSNTAPTSNSQQQQQQNSAHNPSGNYVIDYTPPQKVMHSSWNVMGIPPSGKTRGSPSSNQNNTPYKGGSPAYQQSPAQGQGQQGSPTKQSPGYRNQHWSSNGIF